MPRTSSRGERFPQMGDLPQPYHKTDKSGAGKFTDAGGPDIGLKFGAMPDLKQPANAVAAAGNFAHSIQSAPAAFHETGKLWYPKVNEAVRKGVKGRGFLGGQPDKVLAGAGIVAAVSPNMDWDKNNIGAFSELKGLKSQHWNAIMGARTGSNPRALRSQQAARDAVTGLSISSASIANLQKAGRIVHGESPHDVMMGSGGGPKTFNFMHNIADPTNPNHVTIDGRAFDTLTNMVRPWDTGRGISTHNLARGTSRYEDASSIVQGVAHHMGLDPSAAQAISWEHVKYGVEQSGRTRKQGPMRRGQAYFDPHTGAPAVHTSLPAASRRIGQQREAMGLNHLSQQFPVG